jgi:uncharacterized protein YjbJ (UPF0337 family)
MIPCGCRSNTEYPLQPMTSGVPQSAARRSAAPCPCLTLARRFQKEVIVDNQRKSDDTLGEEISAARERAKGAAKKVLGDITDDRGLEIEGARENAEGRARQATNNVMDETDGVRGATVASDRVAATSRRADDTVGEEASAFGERVKGATKDAVGHVTGNTRMEREGEIENARGRARQASNDVMAETDGVPGDNAGNLYKKDHYVTGLYSTPESAAHAYNSLTTDHGYAADDINVMMSDDTRKKYFGDVKPGTELSGGTKAAEGFGKGSAIGGGIGAALGAIFAIGTSIVIPGIGLVVAGPIAAALAGAGAGGATGGLIGALIGAGIPEERAKLYEHGIREGGIVIGTRARDEKHAADLERDFGKYGGTHVWK